MTIHLYNTLTRAKEAFVPRPHNGGDPAPVTMYVCGPTVYSAPHIGNARPAVVFDTLARLLRSRYTLIYARNVTDVDDKINASAATAGVDISEIAAENLLRYHDDMRALGVLPPDLEPHATDHIDLMIDMIGRLIAGGYAYEASGHVLFRVSSFDAYGALSKRDPRELLAGARVEVAAYKEAPGDFVLWKPSTPELPGWESPWGRGRPGWHIECSVMAAKHLGRTIDIHGGGVDLIFPHHENEIAQSTCAHGGEPFARYWLHNGYVNVDHTKMSKSRGNILLVRDLVKLAPGEAIRLALLNAHYRQPLDWTQQALTEARRKLDRLYGTLRDIAGWQALWPEAAPDETFIAALEDDLNTPKALAALFDLSRKANRSASAEQGARVAAILRASAEFLGLLGADPEQWFTQTGAEGSAGEELDSDAIGQMIAQRKAARAGKDFATADRIRDDLAARGIQIEDGADGTRWRRV
ncbi:MAG: cysteine--tRNA ligase [Gammaproteobacteria bacterium]|nr:MAG: cysteine--tRNA ligase [Gammaproteobacteria bacterium]